MLAKITRGCQISIPKAIIKQAHMEEGCQYVDIVYSKGEIHLKPVEVEERISPEQHEKFLRWAMSDEELAAEFPSFDEMLKDLKSPPKKKA
jgi:bifunctional DNA-binding transcriptional regulator/antitoxin component of YhaV-PrlF toxin-antitoxin module